MADKYQLDLFGDTEAFGPVVELTTEELKVLGKVFGNERFYLAGDYEWVKLVNVSEQERKWEEERKKQEQAKRAKKEAAAALRKKIVVTTTYGNYSAMAIAFAKAKEKQRRR